MHNPSSIIEILPWDTQFFGYRIARIYYRQCRNIPSQHISRYLADEEIALVYCILEDSHTVSDDEISRAETLASSLGDIFQQEKIIFSKPFQGSSSGDLPPLVFEYSSGSINEQLLNLAYEAGIYSRYRLDPHFKQNEFKRLYSEWMKNSLSHTFADKVYAARENNRILGMITLKKKNSSMAIGLISVAKEARGKHIGTSLIEAAEYYAGTQHTASITVATQASNAAAAAFYRKCGFRQLKKDCVFHIWPEE